MECVCVVFRSRPSWGIFEFRGSSWCFSTIYFIIACFTSGLSDGSVGWALSNIIKVLYNLSIYLIITWDNCLVFGVDRLVTILPQVNTLIFANYLSSIISLTTIVILVIYFSIIRRSNLIIIVPLSVLTLIFVQVYLSLTLTFILIIHIEVTSKFVCLHRSRCSLLVVATTSRNFIFGNILINGLIGNFFCPNMLVSLVHSDLPSWVNFSF
jgi:hypothetical protein